MLSTDEMQLGSAKCNARGVRREEEFTEYGTQTKVRSQKKKRGEMDG